MYGLLLFISFRPFLPSLRVLRMSQVSEVIISMLSVTSEIKIVLKLIIIYKTIIKFLI